MVTHVYNNECTWLRNGSETLLGNFAPVYSKVSGNCNLKFQTRRFKSV